MTKASFFVSSVSDEVRRFVDRVAAIEEVAAVAVFPDVHLTGALDDEPSCVGTAIATRGLLVPAWLGADLGCGVSGLPLGTTGERARTPRVAKRALEALARAVPIQRRAAPLADVLEASVAERAARAGASRHELGTVGRGNHFVELREARDDGELWLLVHSGSRSFGPRLQERARRDAPGRRGGFGCLEAGSDRGLAYLDDVATAVTWARENRRAIACAALDALGDLLAIHPRLEDAIDTFHDGVHHETHVLGGEPCALFVHRKGAMKLDPGERGLVPGSMGADVAIVRARRHAPSLALGSSAHGAGRALSRTEARRTHDVHALATSMRGVLFDARRARALVDEIPLAYKDLDEVLAAERDLVTVEARLAPLVVHKGTG
ncbi:MAG: RtcB family protein [Sandaracinus sp.]